jgi:hypothetical protein
MEAKKIHLPEDSPKKEKIVFFKDEGDILDYIKHENTTALVEYFKTNGYEKKLMLRFVGYAVNMVKPHSFKSLCLMDMSLIPPNTMKRVFHVILCEQQDNVGTDRMNYLVGAAQEIVDFLVEYRELNSDDINNAIEIYEDYDMDYMGSVVKFMKNNIRNALTEV